MGDLSESAAEGTLAGVRVPGFSGQIAGPYCSKRFVDAGVAKAAQLDQERLHRMLSAGGSPELRSLGALLDALGIRLSVELNTTGRGVELACDWRAQRGGDAVIERRAGAGLLIGFPSDRRLERNCP